MNNFCPSCGSKVTEDSQFCVNCGYNLGQVNGSKTTNETVENINQEMNNQVFTNQPNNNISQPNNGYTNGIGIAGFVVSLISWFCCCGSLSWLSLIFSIIGLKNAKNNNGAGHGLSMAGLVISIIGLVIILVYLFLFFIAMMAEMAFIV